MSGFWHEKNVEHIKIIEKLADDSAAVEMIERVGMVIVDAYKRGNRLLTCGNGGSAADSQHMAAELVGCFLKERRAFDAGDLSVDTSIITALGNDYSYDYIFARQVEAKEKAATFLWVSLQVETLLTL